MARQAARRAAHRASCAGPTYPDMLAKIKGEGQGAAVGDQPTGRSRRLPQPWGASRTMRSASGSYSAVGGANETDMSLARPTVPAIAASNVRPTPQAHELAEVGRRWYPDLFNHLGAGRGRP